jgi:hypothetical protein
MNGIPPGERYRASYMATFADGTDSKPGVIGDYATRAAAREVCEKLAGRALDWKATPLPGMEGAIAAMDGGPIWRYGVLDRYAKPAPQQAGVGMDAGDPPKAHGYADVKRAKQNYYVVNAGRGRSTHIMKSKSPSTPNPLSPGSIAAQLLWFGGNPKYTLCGLQATRYVNVFEPGEASCRECRKRWQLDVAAAQAAARVEAERWQRQAERRQRYREMPGLDRTADDVVDAGGSAYAAKRYESGSERWRRRYLSRHPTVARRLFPDGLPD